jgi:hypothetical protein
MKMGRFRQSFGKDAHLTEEAVSLYVDALKLGRTGSLPSSILQHVESCHDCKKEITGLFSLLAEVDYSKTGPHPFFDEVTGKTQGHGFSILKIAAAVVAVMGLALLGYMSLLRTSQNTNELQPPTSTTGEDTAFVKKRAVGSPKQQANEQSLLAARFTESPELEDLLRSSARSAETGVQSPANGSTIHRGWIFRWTTPALPPYDITILDNRRHVVRSFQLDTSAFILKDSLQAGLYYWKLGAEGSLLLAGKFIVR